VCVEKKREYCCFNSKLAKLINRQGRAQLSLPMDSCGGFNQEQLEALDFSAMDLSEFMADIIPADSDLSGKTEQVEETVEQSVKDYYNQ
jgi:conjugal transfer mating pair stabilization protein TraN